MFQNFDPIEYNKAKLEMAKLIIDQRALQGTGSGIGGRVDSNGTEKHGMYAGSGGNEYAVDPATRNREMQAFVKFLYNAGEVIGSYVDWNRPFYVHPNENDLLGGENIWAQFISTSGSTTTAKSEGLDLGSVKRTVSQSILTLATAPGIIVQPDGKVVDESGEQVVGPNGVALEAAHIDAAETEIGVCSSVVLPDAYYEAKEVQFDRVRKQIIDNPDIVDLEELPEQLRLKFEAVLPKGESLTSLPEDQRTEILKEYDHTYVSGQRAENRLSSMGLTDLEKIKQAAEEIKSSPAAPAQQTLATRFDLARSGIIIPNSAAPGQCRVPDKGPLISRPAELAISSLMPETAPAFTPIPARH